MAIAIKVENLSKAYQLGQFSTGTISKDLQRWWALARGKEDPFLKIGETNDRASKGASDVVWSLRDINFEIEQGDAVGIIGRNGAGKSTLLKVLSQVTTPTTGSVKVKGRAASLLEVGTGFHPELTGRENIFLNGAILGMRKTEIARKFDEIVDFSGVERYIDTPVKRYSSGMYVRLAFAVAAHLESEILIVDEVLAVGDAEFQKKCLGKMGEISQGQGRTILFVSHNMSSIQNLCKSGILLRNGEVEAMGSSSSTTAIYAKSGLDAGTGYFTPKTHLPVYFRKIELFSGTDPTNCITTDEEITIAIEIEVKQILKGVDFLFFINSVSISKRIFLIEKSVEAIVAEGGLGTKTIKLTLPKNSLMPGIYSCEMGFLERVTEYIDYRSDVGYFEIEQGNNSFLKYGEREIGLVFPMHKLIEIE